MTEYNLLPKLCGAKRVWVVGAIHGDATRLYALHDKIAEKVRPGDRLVYTGNMIGVGPQSCATLDELLTFRRWFLSIPPFVHNDDIIYLRGAQEEMWQKLLQLQFARHPDQVLDWMLPKGLEATIRAYGFDPAEGRTLAREGTVALTHWTQALQETVHKNPGHDQIMVALRHAARTDNGKLLLVNAGLDITKPLDRQADAFWWAGRSFAQAENGFDDYIRVIRGYDPDHKGLAEKGTCLTLDGGCGYGGPLAAACLDPDGALLDLIKV
ncbi:hypothetical protein [Aestuariispira insulae]|uniref:Calcineurin-like phosphoesterase family protein n=1 Tax=Aestuariispira insulae TaxID=1461337 RepID=A0A3D9HPS9_9PROT|nr:hypothetical protein [Aestuariispira insulae]RED51480.1 hypothetical protein DFP90_103282 [Aestuariispira insulae]